MTEFTYSLGVVISPSDSDELLLQSLNSIINQSQLPDEILILKNGNLNLFKNKSIDQFRKLLSNSVKIIMNSETLDFANALNLLINTSKCDYFIRHDPDDISTSNRIKIIRTQINKYKYDIFCSSMLEYDRTRRNADLRVGPSNKEKVLRKLKFLNPIFHPTVVISKKKLIQAGGYEKALLAEDYLIWLKLFDTDLNFGYFKKPLVVFDSTNKFSKRSSLHLVNTEFKLLKYKIKIFNPIIQILVHLTRIIYIFIPYQAKKFIDKFFIKSYSSEKIEKVLLKNNLPINKEMIMKDITIDVIIPHYNRPTSLNLAIKSIEHQNISNSINIIVVDDNSKMKIELDTKPKDNINISLHKTATNSGGPATPRNLGLVNSKSDIVAFLDSDDQWSENHLASALQKVPYDLGYAQNIFGKCISNFSMKSLIFNNLIITSSVVLPRKLVMKVGDFPISSGHLIYEDYAYWLRCTLFLNFFLSGENNVLYTTNSVDSYRKSYASDQICLQNTFQDFAKFLEFYNIKLSFFYKTLIKYRFLRSLISNLLW